MHLLYFPRVEIRLVRKLVELVISVLYSVSDFPPLFILYKEQSTVTIILIQWVTSLHHNLSLSLSSFLHWCIFKLVSVSTVIPQKDNCQNSEDCLFLKKDILTFIISFRISLSSSLILMFWTVRVWLAAFMSCKSSSFCFKDVIKCSWISERPFERLLHFLDNIV